jgi:hypothetical protein
VRRTVPPSAELEGQIEQLLAVGVGENPRESLSELARLGARLIIQRAVEDEFDAWLGRARYERRPEYQRGLRHYGSGVRNGFRPRKVQTAEGELPVEAPQVREAAEPFVSKLFPCSTKVLRTEPLRAMAQGAWRDTNPWHRLYIDVKRRKQDKSNPAKTAVARKLLIACWHVLSRNEPVNPSRTRGGDPVPGKLLSISGRPTARQPIEKPRQLESQTVRPERGNRNE